MKVPLQWLNEYVTVGDQAEELMRRLTAVGHMQDGPAKTVGNDLVYDLEVRQNRSDVLSLVGVAREAAAVLEKELRLPEAYSHSLPEPHGSVGVSIEDADLGYRFNALVMEDISVGPSPDWLRERLETYGIKSVNNLVDITNFVMVEIGQPLHAFDLDQIAGNHLVVRSAKPKEKLTVLGGKELALTEDDLVIADNEKVLALAGVMGGEGSAVSDQTQRIVLEAATYNQASVRRSTLRHNLRTEASTRLEKFLHPHLTELALLRAGELIADVCGGIVVGHADAYPEPRSELEITLTLPYLNTISGVTFSLDEAQQLLSRIFIPSEQAGEDHLLVHVPYFRTDLEQEADIVEEVVRMYGYDRLPSHLPAAAPPASLQSPAFDLGEKVRDYLIAVGFDEQVTEPLTNEDEPQLQPVHLENSLTSEKVMLRTTLRPMLQQGLVYRRKYHHETVKIFEVGKIYWQEADTYRERHTLGLLMAGPATTYAQVKGIIEELFLRLGYALETSLFTIEFIDETTLVVELDLEKLLAQPQVATTEVYTTPPQLIRQDLSITVPTSTPVGEMIAQVKSVSELVYTVKLGEKPFVVDQRKNVFLRLTYHDPNGRLRDEDVQPIREKIIAQLQSQFQAELR